MDLKSFYKSLKFFLKLLFIKKNYDVVFVSFNHFNRGKNGENIFFKPFIDVCKNNNLNYVYLEETDLKGAFNNYPRNKDAIPLDFITFLQVILRKLFSKENRDYSKYDIYYEREIKVSKFLKRLFFKNFKSNVYIMLAHNNVVLWREINKKAFIMDYQHGMIWNGHDSTMINNKPAPIKKLNNVKTLVYGKGFQELLISNDKTNFFNKKNVIPIGYYLPINSFKHKNNNKIILYTLQNVDMESNEKYYNIIKKIIFTNADFFEKNGYKIFFKNHPRYDKNDKLVFDKHFSFIYFINDNLSLKEFLRTKNVSIHITSKSTTAFDVALRGIPTIFIDMLKIRSPREMFVEQYKYPFENFIINKPIQLQKILNELENTEYYNKVSSKVYEWARYFYSDFDEKLFFKLVKQSKNV